MQSESSALSAQCSDSALESLCTQCAVLLHFCVFGSTAQCTVHCVGCGLLQQRFGVVDAHDRASALARVSKTYISNGSGISLKDATRQLDRMMEAHSEFTDAGGEALQD